MPRRTICQAAALFVALVLPIATPAAEKNWRVVVDAAILPLMARHDVPGMAVGIAVDGRSLVFNYGVASRQTGAAVTDATIFEVGSVSKMFTTTLAAWAHARGRLSLDDHPGRYLPQLKGRPVDRATLLDLGTYTAGGLPLQFSDEVSDDAAALAFLRMWKAIALPGTVRVYSNPSIGLLGAVTAAALQDRYANLVETRLLEPLGMHRTFVRVPPRAMEDYAWGEREGQAVRVRPGAMDAPTYGVKSTAADLLRFVQANIDPGGLDATLQRAIASTQAGRYRIGPMVQGFGWQQYAYPASREMLLGGNSTEILFDPQPVHRVAPRTATGPRLFDKTGSTGGFGAYVAFVPSRRIGVVLLANKNVPIPARVEAAFEILERLSPGER